MGDSLDGNKEIKFKAERFIKTWSKCQSFSSKCLIIRIICSLFVEIVGLRKSSQKENSPWAY